MVRGSNDAALAKRSLRISQENTTATPGPQRAEQTTVPRDLQQRCLDVFRDALAPSPDRADQSSNDDEAILQEVKGHLYRRDFAAAFGKEEYLRAYAARWSPARALAYLQVLTDAQGHLFNLSIGERGAEDDGEQPCRVVCIGGGAGAELVAFAAWLHSARRASDHDNRPTSAISCVLLDIAAWDAVVSHLLHAIHLPPALSPYASAAARERNFALAPALTFNAHFHRADALHLDAACASELFAAANLVTLLFTLNELYAASVPRTQALLARITREARPGAHLLVVDSPGTYSTVAINGAERKYPMRWLLDHALLGPQQQKQQEQRPWEKLVADDSRWFRLPKGLKYPRDLEDMRYQIFLYRRRADDDDHRVDSSEAVG